MSGKIRLGISSCLLGNKVRYDGGHKHDRFLTDTLGQWVEYAPVCPEVESGLPVPREALRLVGDPARPRLVFQKSGRDFTPVMQDWAKARLEELAEMDLCGFIFKNRSPSSGMARVKVYNDRGMPSHAGVGIWARMFMDRFPQAAVEEEGRLSDPKLREMFIEKIFVLKRWRENVADDPAPGKLVDFHSRHKLLIMAHSNEHYRRLGRIAARAGRGPLEPLLGEYQDELLSALGYKTTVKKNLNVLQHLLGYFKKDLSPGEKTEFLEILENYRREFVPLLVPLTLINHWVRKYGQEYLAGQYYLNPHPVELKLRNHA